LGWHNFCSQALIEIKIIFPKANVISLPQKTFQKISAKIEIVGTYLNPWKFMG